MVGIHVAQGAVHDSQGEYKPLMCIYLVGSPEHGFLSLYAQGAEPGKDTGKWFVSVFNPAEGKLFKVVIQ